VLPGIARDQVHMNATRFNFKRLAIRLFAVVFLLALTAMMITANLQKPLDHDEQMYIGSGALLERRSLLPYRDYPYFRCRTWCSSTAWSSNSPTIFSSSSHDWSRRFSRH
jgi:hypothetical protein